MNISVRLREEREKLRMTQADMAEAGGVKPQAVSLYEAGKRSPDAKYLERVATVGVDVGYVLTGQRSQPALSPLTPEENALLDNYKQADEAGRAAARRVLDALAQRKAA